MRRALAILKYVPAVLCGLLMVAWVMSLIFIPSWFWKEGTIGVWCVNSSIRLIHAPHGVASDGFQAESYMDRKRNIFGEVVLESAQKPSGRFGPKCDIVSLPIPFLLTISLPLAIGTFKRFRFTLWSYFSWTALIGLELAYYLR